MKPETAMDVWTDIISAYAGHMTIAVALVTAILAFFIGWHGRD